MKDHFTVGEVARLNAVEPWRIRRIADSLGTEIPRAGLYRMIPRALLPAIADELQRRGWSPLNGRTTSASA